MENVTTKKERCNVCGGGLVSIRGKFPGSASREVCPTCTYEILEQIREMTDVSYGRAYQEREK